MDQPEALRSMAGLPRTLGSQCCWQSISTFIKLLRLYFLYCLSCQKNSWVATSGSFDLELSVHPPHCSRSVGDARIQSWSTGGSGPHFWGSFAIHVSRVLMKFEFHKVGVENLLIAPVLCAGTICCWILGINEKLVRYVGKGRKSFQNSQPGKHRTSPSFLSSLQKRDSENPTANATWNAIKRCLWLNVSSCLENICWYF